MISADEPVHLESGLCGKAACPLAPALGLYENSRTETPLLALLDTVTCPVLGKRWGLQGPALKLDFAWTGPRDICVSS